MSTPAQIMANSLNAAVSTGPRTAAGKARSSRNAVKHDLRGRAPIAVLRGPFQEDPEEVQAFVEAVVQELNPVGPQELAEAITIAGLYIRRRRLHKLEAMALSGTTRADLLPPVEAGGPSRITHQAQERAAAQALTCDLLDRLPRYEAHVSRELDRCSARLLRLQAERSVHQSAAAFVVICTAVEKLFDALQVGGTPQPLYAAYDYADGRSTRQRSWLDEDEFEDRR